MFTLIATINTKAIRFQFWSHCAAGEEIPIGKLHINSLAKLRRLAGINGTLGDMENGPCLLDLDPLVPKNQNERPVFRSTCKIFELDTCRDVASVSPHWRILPQYLTAENCRFDQAKRNYSSSCFKFAINPCSVPNCKKSIFVLAGDIYLSILNQKELKPNFAGMPCLRWAQNHSEHMAVG